MQGLRVSDEDSISLIAVWPIFFHINSSLLWKERTFNFHLILLQLVLCRVETLESRLLHHLYYPFSVTASVLTCTPNLCFEQKEKKPLKILIFTLEALKLHSVVWTCMRNENAREENVIHLNITWEESIINACDLKTGTYPKICRYSRK